MENKVPDRYQKTIKVSNGKVEVQFLSSWAGCMVSAAGFMTLAGILSLIYLVPDTGFLRGVIGGFIIIIATLFFGIQLLRILSAIMSGKTVFTVENGELRGKKKSVPILMIKKIEWQRLSIKYILITTMDNKRMKLSTYNLVMEEAVNYVIDHYVVPQGNPEFQMNWERGRKERESIANSHNEAK